jgi:hypothetical protein
MVRRKKAINMHKLELELELTITNKVVPQNPDGDEP